VRGGMRSRELLTVTWGLTILDAGFWNSAERRRARTIRICLMCSTDSRRKRATMRGCRCRCELCRSYPYSDTIDIHISLFDLDSGIRVRMRASRKERRGCELMKTMKPGTLRRRPLMMEACMRFGSKRSRSENSMMFWYVVHPFRSLSDVLPLLIDVRLLRFMATSKIYQTPIRRRSCSCERCLGLRLAPRRW
jgi:hypothetical protein